MKKKEKIYLNSEDIQKINAELKDLIGNARKSIIEEIKEARKQGDLSENAEYDAAKRKQSILEGRINELRAILRNAKIIDQKAAKDLQSVRINSFVQLLNLHNQTKFEVKIGTISELNVEKRIISTNSPLAKSIWGARTGDEIIVKGIRATYKVKILSIKN